MASPRRMVRRTAGLDINDTHVVVSQLGFTRNGNIRLEAAGWTARPAGASDRQLAATVRQLFRQAGVSATHVCMSLQSPSLVLRPFRHVRLTPPELAAALALEAEEALQLPPGDIYLDWHVNHESEITEGVIVAAPRQEIDGLLSVLAQADVFPVIVDAACLAVCNLYLKLRSRPSTEHALCVVSLANRRADIAVLWADSSIFPRTVFAPSGNWEQDTAYLAEEIVDTIKYHQFKLHGLPVDRMVLTGAVPQREVLVAHLREVVPLVSYWNPVADMKTVKPRLRPLMGGEDGAMLATSLGLALRRN